MKFSMKFESDTSIRKILGKKTGANFSAMADLSGLRDEYSYMK